MGASSTMLRHITRPRETGINPSALTDFEVLFERPSLDFKKHFNKLNKITEDFGQESTEMTYDHQMSSSDF